MDRGVRIWTEEEGYGQRRKDMDRRGRIWTEEEGYGQRRRDMEREERIWNKERGSLPSLLSISASPLLRFSFSASPLLHILFSASPLLRFSTSLIPLGSFLPTPLVLSHPILEDSQTILHLHIAQKSHPHLMCLVI